ncbi:MULTISPECIES: C40 family peptidase [Streptomyces]|uniref:C40 family peptidase n=1 Tax=Streptomyces TaxID=1883 RepID=UPI00163BEDE8|nr:MULTISPECIES: C40 family peptidase [Streptomyces]MBC2878074.1 C40 family peptidase [Streptomyces sp. TYQ1024]UBI40024.1 C40 family peptidase [Streptomyces mobaraensis]UKW32604.1 C40 family peptidase [Streptomyces sp. TYQ1024]
MKGIAAVLGVVCLSPLLIAGAAATAAAGSGGAHSKAANCTTGADIDTDAVAKQVASILGGKGSKKDVHVEGLELPAEQIPNAKTIVATGISLKVPERGQIVALATAMQESRIRNLNYGDRDSLGIFQQRPSQGWGTPQQIRDPVYASTRFYKALLEVHGWQQMTVTQAAQAVQASGLPDAYAQWEPLSRALQQTIVKTLPDSGKNAAGTKNSKDSKDKDTPAPSGGGCKPGEDGSGYGPIPEGAVPKGYSIPKDANPKARKAIEWAMHQLGTMYQWGGECTNPHGPDPMGRCDCSSLMQQAYAHAGVQLSRTTYTQVNEGKPVSPKSLQPGDLLFARGTAAVPEHVGMYMGTGLVIEAPRTTKPVRIQPVKDWNILAARRVI